MHYYNSTINKHYYGGTITYAINKNKIFAGVPTVEQLIEWGFEEVVETPYVPTEEDIKLQRMQEIIEELKATDYLALKDYEGEDMSEHPGWKEHRAALRVEYRELEASLA